MQHSHTDIRPPPQARDGAPSVPVGDRRASYPMVVSMARQVAIEPVRVSLLGTGVASWPLTELNVVGAVHRDDR